MTFASFFSPFTNCFMMWFLTSSSKSGWLRNHSLMRKRNVSQLIFRQYFLRIPSSFSRFQRAVIILLKFSAKILLSPIRIQGVSEYGTHWARLAPEVWGFKVRIRTKLCQVASWSVKGTSLMWLTNLWALKIEWYPTSKTKSTWSTCFLSSLYSSAGWESARCLCSSTKKSTLRSQHHTLLKMPVILWAFFLSSWVVISIIMNSDLDGRVKVPISDLSAKMKSHEDFYNFLEFRKTSSRKRILYCRSKIIAQCVSSSKSCRTLRRK